MEGGLASHFDCCKLDRGQPSEGALLSSAAIGPVDLGGDCHGCPSFVETKWRRVESPASRSIRTSPHLQVQHRVRLYGFVRLISRVPLEYSRCSRQALTSSIP